MLASKDLKRNLKRLPLVRVQAAFYRVVAHEYIVGSPKTKATVGMKGKPEPLWPWGSSLKGARYTSKGAAPALYLASDAALAMLEIEAIFTTAGGALVSNPGNPLVTLTVGVDMDGVVDLRDPQTLLALGTSLQELTGEWRYTAGTGGVPPTQLLGENLHATRGVRGALAHSAKRVGQGHNLIVFPDRLVGSDSFVEIVDTSRKLSQRLP